MDDAFCCPSTTRLPHVGSNAGYAKLTRRVGVRVRGLHTLSGKHDGVGTVKNSVRYVRALGTRWARVGNHRLQHLG